MLTASIGPAQLSARLPPPGDDAEEIEVLSRRHRELVMRKYEQGLSRGELGELALTRWTIDRLEAAAHGDQLDRLEAAVKQYQEVAADVDRLVHLLEEHDAMPRAR